MKILQAFIQKEFYHILRDKRTILILLIMPVMMILIFGFAISTEVQDIRCGIVAPNYTQSIQQSVERIKHNPYFISTPFYEIPQQAELDIKNNLLDMALIFPSDWNKTHQLNILIDASNPTLAQSEYYYLLGTILPNDTSIKMLYNPSMHSAFNFLPGIMGLIFILIGAMMTSVSIVGEKEKGSMEILLASPINPFQIILAKMIPYFTIAFVNLLTILIIAYSMLHIPINYSSMLPLVGISIIYIALALALGLLISNVVSSQVAALFISLLGLMLPVLFLSGMIFPIENMPIILQKISNLVPARWYIDAVRKLLIQGLSLEYIYKELIILISMFMGITGIATGKFKRKLN